MKTATMLCALGATMGLGLAACADQGAEKPTVDPDEVMLNAAKADRLTDSYLKLSGAVAATDLISGRIDYPDWFHGYTLELRQDQVVDLDFSATARGYVRVYGPAYAWVDGEPRFSDALYAGRTRNDHGKHRSNLRLTTPVDGTYLFVYGPMYVWDAAYQLGTTCVDNCRPTDACASDAECADGEFCGDNGARCVTEPCDVNYDVCQPKLGVNGFCTAASQCANDLPCINNRCTDFGGGTGDCADDTDCAAGFCGWAEDNSRLCKPFSAEGQGCGGHVMLHAVTQCEPGLACVGPWQAYDLPGFCGTSATLAEIAADPRAFDGRFVVTTGHLASGLSACTEMGCPASDPCCNRCSSVQALYQTKEGPITGEAGLALFEEGERYRCAGDECNPTLECSAEVGLYDVAGWLTVVDGELRLEVLQRQPSLGL